MGSSPTGGVVSSPGLHNFFSCFTVLSRSCPSAKKTSHLDTTLLLPPLPRCRQRFASAYQPPAIFRSCSWTQLFFCRFLGAGNASLLPTSRQLFSVPALHPGNRHRGDSSPCGQSPMDFESISLAARTQCLLPARTHHATWHTESFLLVSHLSSHCGSHWFTVLSHLQLVSSMAKKQASQSPKNIPKHKLVGPSAQNSSVCKCGYIYREHKGNK